MLDLRQIQYFVCLYEERSVTRAARRLNVVQPALSMQISRLEKRLGTDLFERTARGMIPTSAAEAMYRIYLPILLDLKHADQQMMELTGKVLGKIAVGIIPSITNSVLADVLHHFGAEYPDVEIRIDEAYSGTLIDWVVAGDLDFAVVNRTRRKADVTMHPLIDEELVLVERGTSKRNLKPIRFARLKQLDLVLPSRRHGIRNIVDHAAEEIGIQITPRIEVDALAPTLKVVSESGLTTVLPAIVARRSTAQLRLQTRRIVEPVLKRQLVYALRSQRQLSRIFKAFIDILSEELKRGAAPKRAPKRATNRYDHPNSAMQ
jgi:LysR family transcriptional regulator, nitrogen assimilation regulatory protein